ncbi:hypothetical protein GYMLUDRAFT_82265 [Collybiopsis luxurians FD-317 M1]|nr:hypothetical protein GYMLUDRAFT_82265 [Collybiopsis luxurians FD-317 M1]
MYTAGNFENGKIVSRNSDTVDPLRARNYPGYNPTGVLLASIVPENLICPDTNSTGNNYWRYKRCLCETWNSSAIVSMLSVQRGLIRSFNPFFVCLSFFLGCLLSLLAGTKAEPTNKTIDDTDPAFSFSGSNWNAITPGNPCGGCSTSLNSSLTYNSSWHDGAFIGLTGSLTFEAAAQTAEIAFVVDDGAPTNYDLNTVDQSVFHIYNSLFFSSSGLSNGQHTLSWTLTSVTGSPSFSSAPVHVALIDYAVVTSDINSSPSNGQSNNGLNSAISNTVTATESVTSTVIQTQVSSSSTSTGSSTTSAKSINSSTALPTALKSALGGSASGTFSTTPITVAVSSSGSSVQTSSSVTPSAIGGESQRRSKTRLIITAGIGSTAGAILILCIILFVRRKRYLDRNEYNIPESGSGFDARGTRYLSEKRRMLGTAEDRNPSVMENERSGIIIEQIFLARLVTVIDPTAEADSQLRQRTENYIDSNGQIQQMEQRLTYLERMLQSPIDDRPVSFTSPPPY